MQGENATMIPAAGKHFPVFLSLVVVLRNLEAELEAMLREMSALLGGLVADYEIIVVDNASTDRSVALLKSLTLESGLPNLQIFTLTKEVDTDTASWAGIENALGDYVAVIDPTLDSVHYLPEMLDKGLDGADVVFAANRARPRQNLVYRMVSGTFYTFYYWLSHVHLDKEAPGYRLLSRRLVNFILRHPAPSISYRHLPATGGFARLNLSYHARPKHERKKSLLDSIERGTRLLVSTTHAPMRLVTALSLFGAVANLLYCIYVLCVAMTRQDIAPGWTTLSLQQSGMFFLISLVLLVLGEYILHMAKLSNEGPLYHVAQEFTSAVMTRHSKLNIEEARSAAQA